MLPTDLSESLSSVLVFETVHSSSEKSMIKRDLKAKMDIMRNGE